MIPRLISILIFLVPIVTSAQIIKFEDPEYDEIVKSDCNGMVFTKYEQLPSFKISKHALEDSITVYLKANNAFDADSKFAVQFLLTKELQILDVGKLSGAVPSAHFMKGLVRFSHLWTPAKQNGHEVCAFVKCKVEVKDDRLNFTVFR